MIHFSSRSAATRSNIRSIATSVSPSGVRFISTMTALPVSISKYRLVNAPRSDPAGRSAR